MEARYARYEVSNWRSGPIPGVSCEHHNELEELGLSSVGGGHASGVEGN